MSKQIEIAVTVKAQTEKALLVETDKGEAWVPVSQITDYCEDNAGNITDIFISEWLATEKGLV